MVKQIFFLLVTLIAVFCLVASVQPEDFNVSRSAIYSAPIDTIFPKVNNLHEWNSWSPWAKKDPNAVVTYEGPQEGVGAVMKWESKSNEVGTGSMTIVQSAPNEKVVFDLVFISPFEGKNSAQFDFEKVGEDTKVTWNMFGKKNFMAKAMGLVFNCDKMVGGDFEQGLSNLKPLVESNK